MNISVNHALPAIEAKNRISKLAEELKKEYGSQIKNYSEKWNGNAAEIAFKAMGLNIKGDLNILLNKVTMTGKLPLMARPYKSQIENLIKTKLAELLA
jgi:antitoxin component of RelBE/YafQ-DinJ toxin-antitoxin module